MVSIRSIRVVCRLCFMVAMFLLGNADRASYGQAFPPVNQRLVSPLAQNPPAKPANGKQVRYWSTTWEFESIDIERLQRRLKAVGIDLGMDLKGDVSVKLQVGIPWNAIRDGKAYRFDGSVSSPHLSLDELEIEAFESSVSYQDGVLTLSNLSGQIPEESVEVAEGVEVAGRIRGRGTLELIPRGDAKAELFVEHLAVHPVRRLLTRFYPNHANWFPTAGTLSGEMKFRVPVKQISETQEMSLAGNLVGTGLQASFLPATDVELNGLSIESNRLKVPSFQLTSMNPISGNRPFQLQGRVDLPLTPNGEFAVTVTGDDLPIEDFLHHGAPSQQNSPTIVQVKVDVRLNARGSINGSWNQAKWSIDGAFASPSLRMAGLDLGTFEHQFQVTPGNLSMRPIRESRVLPAHMRIGTLSIDYARDHEALRIPRMHLTAFRGSLSGSCQLPLNGQGDFLAELTLQDISPLVHLPFAVRAHSRVRSRLSGKVTWRAPIVGITSPVNHQGDATITARDIELDRQKIGAVTTTTSLHQGTFAGNATGNLLGGTVRFETKAELQESDSWSNLVERMQFADLQFQRLDVSRLAELALGFRPSYSARASGNVRINQQATAASSNQLPKTDFELSLEDVRYRTRLLSRQVKLKGQTNQNVLLIRSLVGDYGEGTVRLAGQVYPFDGQSNFHPKLDLQVGVSRVRLDRASWFLGEDVAKQLGGYATARASVTGYQESLRLRGSVEGRELRVNSLPIGAAHSGVNARLDLNQLAWCVHFPTIRSHVGGGQLEGEVFVKSSLRGGLDLDSTWKSQRVDFLRLMSQLGTSTSFARGKVSGVLTVGGKGIEALEDATGRFGFRLEQTQGAAIPGLIAASQFLGPISLASQSFETGEAKGVIGKGIVSIDEFWVGSDTALVRADGKVYLRSGRMDLQALIATGDYGDVAVNFAKIAQQYAVQTLIPASAIVSVTEILRDRTLVLSVMGTTRNPIVRLRPVETFREETVRFLLREGRRLIVASIAAESADALDAF